ncbi:MAG: hypothetical protein EZS28_044423, partial [Streblomastix strix]
PCIVQLPCGDETDYVYVETPLPDEDEELDQENPGPDQELDQKKPGPDQIEVIVPGPDQIEVIVPGPYWIYVNVPGPDQNCTNYGGCQIFGAVR